MPLLHPTPGSVLNHFTTRRPDIYPHLAFPFHHALAGKTATFVSDGETVMLWTERRLPGYRNWLRDTGPGDFDPLVWMKMYCGGAATPLPPLPSRKGTPLRMVVAGNVAHIPFKVAAALAAMDTCWIGISQITPVKPGWPLPVVSLTWSLGSMAGKGVIICADKI